jgi:hypothetical protein
MSEDIHALADAAQAVYFRGHLQQERADLTVELAHYTKTLTACRVAGDMRRVSGRVAGDMRRVSGRVAGDMRRVSDLPHD